MTNFEEYGAVAEEKESGLELLLSMTENEKKEFIQVWNEVCHLKSIEQRRDYICNRVHCQACD